MLLIKAVKDRKRHEAIKRIENDIKAVSEAMKTAESCFNEVEDPNLTDAVIYDRAALEARYNYLLKELKRFCAAE